MAYNLYAVVLQVSHVLLSHSGTANESSDSSAPPAPNTKDRNSLDVESSALLDASFCSSQHSAVAGCARPSSPLPAPENLEFVGSADIIQQFIRERKPVRRPELHAHANLLLTLLRSLGLCARTVSCVETAHDTDQSLTVDRTYVRQDFAFVPMLKSEVS